MGEKTLSQEFAILINTVYYSPLLSDCSIKTKNVLISLF